MSPPRSSRPRVLLAMHRALARKLFDPDALDRLARIADFDRELVVDDFTTP